VAQSALTVQYYVFPTGAASRSQCVKRQISSTQAIQHFIKKSTVNSGLLTALAFDT
jgi:hypothetical protein